MKRIIPLKGKKIFSLLFRRGKKIDSTSFCIIVLRTKLSNTRIAVVIAKSAEKKAVARNRLRRRIREAVKKIIQEDPHSYDLVFLVKKEAAHTARLDLYEELERKIKEI